MKICLLFVAAVCDQPCQNGGQCVAPNQCKCRLGFIGDHCELDLDECTAQGADAHRCHPNSDCHNRPGWYTCACKAGFRAPLHDTILGSLCHGTPINSTKCRQFA